MKALIALSIAALLTGCAMTEEQGRALAQGMNDASRAISADTRARHYNNRSYNCTSRVYGNRVQTNCK